MRYINETIDTRVVSEINLTDVIDKFHDLGYKVEVECDYNAPSNERYRLKVFKPVEEDL